MSRAPRMVVIEPTGVRREVTVSTTPFKMGRQAGTELTLRDSRISRIQAQINVEEGAYFIEDLGSRHGTFVNGQRVTRQVLHAKDTIDFGIPDSYRLIFMGLEASLDDLLERVEKIVPTGAEAGEGSLAARQGGRELYHLGVLLEVARVLHAGMTLEDVDWLIPHQANVRILEATARKLGLPREKLVVTVDHHGNTSAASVPLALDEYLRAGKIRPGQRLLLQGVGGGFTWGSTLLTL